MESATNVTIRELTASQPRCANHINKIYHKITSPLLVYGKIQDQTMVAVRFWG